MSDTEQPLTKSDLQSALRDMERDLKQFILEREIIALRWVVGVQITYFGITLASVWFLINHLPK
jgi:hypothetical protein